MAVSTGAQRTGICGQVNLRCQSRDVVQQGLEIKASLKRAHVAYLTRFGKRLLRLRPTCLQHPLHLPAREPLCEAGGPDAIRTHDLLIRNQLLYPAELRDHKVALSLNGGAVEEGMMGRLFAIFVSLTLVACAPSSPLPNMEAGESGRVVRVIDGDALALNTGQSVRLIGMEAPALRPRGREPDTYAVEASRTLEDMAMGREVRLYYSGMTRDRYDRALAHVVTTDGSGPELWLNMELVKRGAARVRFYPDTASDEAAFLEAEAQARTEKTGLWGKSAYRIRDAARLPTDTRGFVLITAVLGTAARPTGRYAHNQTCQRALLSAELVLEVRKGAGEICDLPDGTRLLLRGWVSGGRMDLTLPQHAETLTVE